MKKILFILLLVSNFCFSQTSPTIGTGAGSSIQCTGFPQGFSYNKGYTKNVLYITFFVVEQSVGNTSISEDSVHWEFLGTLGNTTKRISVYACMPTYNVTNESSVFSFSPGINGFITRQYEITGAVLGSNGLNAIRQVVKDSASASADPVITMAALTQHSSVLTFWTNDNSPFAGTPESGWTEYQDGGCSATLTWGSYQMYRNGTSDNTPSITSSASTWKGIAIEIRGYRRITLID